MRGTTAWIAGLVCAAGLVRDGYAQPASERGPDDAITDLEEILDEDAPATLADAAVHLEDVPVRGKSGNGLWIGHTSRRQIFVAPIDPSFVDFVTVGARVDLRGNLRQAPAAPQAAKVFALDARSKRRIADDRFYIEAWTITYMD